MLVLTRETGETIRIGDDIEMTIISLRNGQVRIGFNAPKEIKINREEIYQRIQKEKANLESGAANV